MKIKFIFRPNLDQCKLKITKNLITFVINIFFFLYSILIIIKIAVGQTKIKNLIDKNFNDFLGFSLNFFPI